MCTFSCLIRADWGRFACGESFRISLFNQCSRYYCHLYVITKLYTLITTIKEASWHRNKVPFPHHFYLVPPLFIHEAPPHICTTPPHTHMHHPHICTTLPPTHMHHHTYMHHPTTHTYAPPYHPHICTTHIYAPPYHPHICTTTHMHLWCVCRLACRVLKAAQPSSHNSAVTRMLLARP